MTLHTGRTYSDGEVSLIPPDVEAVRRAPRADDVARSVDTWLARALERRNDYYFSVCWQGRLVGQIMLHDIDQHAGEALVGYHLFEPQYRGRGVGTRMLALLQQYAAEETTLRTLVVITSDDNVASQRIAQKCGFIHTGAPREGPRHGMCFKWAVPRP
jgi:RimJ/RimL family protein N-acetyltransferase